jgi:hypothetical protein
MDVEDLVPRHGSSSSSSPLSLSYLLWRISLQQPETHISLSSSDLEGSPSSSASDPFLHLDIRSTCNLFTLAQTLEPMLMGILPLSCFALVGALVLLFASTFATGLVGMVVKEFELLGDCVERELWAKEAGKEEWGEYESPRRLSWKTIPLTLVPLNSLLKQIVRKGRKDPSLSLVWSWDPI